MKRRDAVFAAEARGDLLALYEWISVNLSADVAMHYIERIETYSDGFDLRRNVVMPVKTSGPDCAL